MTSYTRAIAGALLLALSSGGMATSAAAAPLPAADPAPSESPAADPLAAQIADTTSQLQTDLGEMRAQQDAARDRYEEARAKAMKLQQVVAENQAEADQARLIVGQYARSIYMSGSTDLSVLASMIDTQDPGELMSRADEALRVGDHKDDQFDDAVRLLKRNQEVKDQADSAQLAAEASLQSIENQVHGLQRQLADVASEWADHLAGGSGFLDAEQAKANSAAAAQWAEYLGRLADLRAPTASIDQMLQGRLPDGLKGTNKNPGVATFTADGETLTVVPDRVMAAITYAVSTLGTPYKWRSNTGTEMDCSALVDRAWNVPSIARGDRTDERELVPGGVSGLAENTQLIPTNRMTMGDVVFLTDPRRGVHHAGIVIDDDTMIAGDAKTGAVNAVPIPEDRVWQVGRLALKSPKRGNFVPKASKKPFQCGADPAAFITMPDGRILADTKLCPPKPEVFGEAHMQPAAVIAGRCAATLWPQLQVIGGWRPSDPYPDHPSGRATDIMLPEGCATTPSNLAMGTAIAEFFAKNHEKFQVQYIIWQQRIWNAEIEEPKPAAEWRGMSNRGSCTANHQDHVHVSFIGPNVAPDVPAVASDAVTTDQDTDADQGVAPKAKNPGGAAKKSND